jgi:hypothetical protein
VADGLFDARLVAGDWAWRWTSPAGRVFTGPPLYATKDGALAAARHWVETRYPTQVTPRPEGLRLAPWPRRKPTATA